MNGFDLSGSTVLQIIGTALMHFLWQGLVIGGLIAITLQTMRNRAASQRYLVCCIGMALMVVAPFITALLLGLSSSPAEGLVAAGTRQPAASSPTNPYLPAISVAWLIGVVALQLRLLVQWIRTMRLCHTGVRPAPKPWQAMVDDLCRQLRVGQVVRIVETTQVAVPMVIGWLRPVILVPTAALTGLSTQQLRAILVHELAHIRRHDYLVNVLQAVCETLLFYHPAVWWLSDRIRVEREFCCDDAAVEVCGDPLGYARALSILDTFRLEPASGPLEPAIASTGGSLMHRITRVVGLDRRRKPRHTWPIALGVLTTLTFSALGVSVVLETPQPRLDVVEIVRQHDPEQAELLSTLEDAGLEEHVLLKVLGELGVSDDLAESLDKARSRESFIHAHLVKLKEHLHELVHHGKIDSDESERKLQAALLHATELYERQQNDKHALHEHLRAMKEDLFAAVEAGDLDMEEAERKLAEAYVIKVHDHMRHHVENDDLVVEVGLPLWVHEELRLDDASPEEVSARIHEFMADQDELAVRLDRENRIRRVEILDDRAISDVLMEEMHVLEHDLHDLMVEFDRRMATDGEVNLELAKRLEAAQERLALTQAEFKHIQERLKDKHHKKRKPASKDEAERMEKELAQVTRKIKELVQAGEISPEEAHEKLVTLQHRIAEKSVHRQEAALRRDALLQHRDQILAELEAGRIDQVTADRRLEELDREFESKRRSRIVEFRLSSDEQAELRERIARTRASLMKSIEEGTIDESEATKRLQHLERVSKLLHEK